MNNRVLVIMILVLSCALLLVGGGLIGATLYLQGRVNLGAAGFPTVSASDALLTPQASTIQVGQPAPDISVVGEDGKVVKLSDFHGKPVMLNFWASWCGPCTAEMKNIESVYQEHKNDDFVILGVNQGENEDTIKGYGDLWKLNFRLLRDGDDTASHLYKIQALPTTVFIDPQGNVSEVHIGGPMSVDFIEQRVKTLLAKVK